MKSSTLIIAALAACTLVAVAPVAATPDRLPPASPDVLSIKFTDAATARDFYNESRSLGEVTCLDTLAEPTGTRYWLHTC